MTGQRYNRLTLSEDLSLQAGAVGEDTLRGSIWRSDGTTDQLYLALRLAVAGELWGQAPLVLDDALVRFDDTRLGAAMDILREAAVFLPDLPGVFLALGQPLLIRGFRGIVGSAVEGQILHAGKGRIPAAKGGGRIFFPIV